MISPVNPSRQKMREQRLTKGEAIFYLAAVACMGGLLTFVTLRDSCFNHSYATNFPSQCNK